MPLQIIIDYGVSLSRLAALASAGFPVMRSPHVGNFNPNNQVLAAVGIPIVAYDYTIGDVDRNYHPHGVIVGGRFYSQSNPYVFTSNAVIERSMPKQAPTLPSYEVGASVSDCHMKALHVAYPKARAVTYTRLLRKYPSLVMGLLETLTEAAPQLWDRDVSVGGEVKTGEGVACWSDVEQRILGVSNLDCGRPIPLAFTITMMCILDAIKFGTATEPFTSIYQLSGPDMYTYITGYEVLLSNLYHAVKRVHGNLKLPETLTVRVVPVSNMRLAVSESKREELNNLVNTWLKFYRAQAEWPALVGALGEQAEPARHKNALMNHGALVEALRACPDVLYRIEERVFHSQHDCVLRGDQLYIHPLGLELSMLELGDMMTTFRQLHFKR